MAEYVPIWKIIGDDTIAEIKNGVRPVTRIERHKGSPDGEQVEYVVHWLYVDGNHAWQTLRGCMELRVRRIGENWDEHETAWQPPEVTA